MRAEAPWLLGGVKSTSYAVNMAAEAEARARGADDAVFVRDDGVVLEGPVTNVWWRRGDTLFTPSLDLGHPRRRDEGGLCSRPRPAPGFEVVEGAFPLADLLAAEEAFTSSSVREVMPAVEVDGIRLARGAGRGDPADGTTEAGRGGAVNRPIHAGTLWSPCPT